MSRKRDFERTAKQMGIIRPIATYHRQSKTYSVSISDVKLTTSRGYTSLEVGNYSALDEAKAQLPDDIRACIDRNIANYPDLLDHVTEKYHIVTSSLSDRDVTYQLLESLLQSYETAQQATIALEYIQALESKVEADTVHPKGTYESSYPDTPKKPIQWQQPDYREHPVYTFELTCPYCGQEVTLERHSPRQPTHCGQPDCATEHNRVLARERKRRQRKRARKESP